MIILTFSHTKIFSAVLRLSARFCKFIFVFFIYYLSFNKLLPQTIYSFLFLFDVQKVIFYERLNSLKNLGCTYPRYITRVQPWYHVFSISREVRAVNLGKYCMLMRNSNYVNINIYMLISYAIWNSSTLTDYTDYAMIY